MRPPPKVLPDHTAQQTAAAGQATELKLSTVPPGRVAGVQVFPPSGVEEMTLLVTGVVLP